MPLPQFSHIGHYNLEPIYKNRIQTSFQFENMKFGCELISISTIKDVRDFSFAEHEPNLMTFNLNVDQDNNVLPLDYLYKIQVENIKGLGILETTNGIGNVVYYVYLHGLKFTEINGLLDFNYIQEESLRTINVKFEYDKLDYVNAKEIKIYKRKLKLNNIK